jgi:Cutinase
VPKDRILTICATGDMICWGLPVISASHMVYSANVGQATTFVSSKIRG